MWEWWNIRNKVNAGESILDPGMVCSKIERLLVDFLSLKKSDKPPKPPDIHKWAKPPDNHVKVNFDGSYLADAGAGGWGYVIRDQAGNFIAAGSVPHLGSALHFEVVACLAAIQGANEIGANRIIFESDASTLVEALKSNDYDMWLCSCPLSPDSEPASQATREELTLENKFPHRSVAGFINF
uniref:Uncharacterized protein n=1 Tax=Avena sativa TaxID=4498 RepID=A0ACD5ZDA9_AVESA